MYSSVATCKNDFLCTLTITCRLQFTTVRCSTTRFLTTILISFSSAVRFFMSISIFLVHASNMFITLGGGGGAVVCYTAIFSVVTQRSSPQTATENRTTFLSLCVCGLTNKPITYLEIDCDVSFRG